MIKNPFDKDYGGWIFMGIIFLFLMLFSTKFSGFISALYSDRERDYGVLDLEDGPIPLVISKI